MNGNDLSAVEALDTIRSIPEWLRAVSKSASQLRRNLDVLEKEAAQFRTILDSSKERRTSSALAAMRGGGSGLIAGIGQSAALMRRFQVAFERRCPANIPVAPPSTEIPTRDGSLTLTFVPVFLRPNGAPVYFTRTEERLLAVLWTTRDAALSGAELTRRIWSNQRVPLKTLKVHVSRLRKKLDEFGVVIEFIRGTGYRLVLEFGTRRR